MKHCADLFGVSIKSVSNALDRVGVERRSLSAASARGKRLTPELKAEVVQRYQRGQTQSHIARSLSMSQHTVRRVLLQEGVYIEDRWQRSGPEASRWGGGVTNNSGYRLVHVPLDSPFASMRMGGTGYVLEHRLVMAKKLGRPLLKGETVHHIDGDRSNNDEANLQLRRGRHGPGAVMRCGDCGSSNIHHLPLDGA